MPTDHSKPPQAHKPALTPQARALWARLHVLIWVLVFAGLLSITLGLSVGGAAAGASATDANVAATWALWLKLAGTAATALGAVLIYIRSRLGD